MSHELLHQIWTFWSQIVHTTMRLEVLRLNYKVEVMLNLKVTLVEDTT